MEASNSPDDVQPKSKRRKALKHVAIGINCEDTNSSKCELKDEMKEIDNETAEPPAWKDIWDNIVKMRANRDAPVDQMGAETYMDPTLPPQVARFQVLISLLLSSQTKDAVTHAAMTKLISHGLTVDNILQTSVSDLGRLIYPVGFWKRKAVYLKKTTEILKKTFTSDIPSDVDNLCRLPGVGPKMAHLCMQIAWNQNVGIGVDTHVHRICNRLKWVFNTKSPEETRKQLEKWLPNEGNQTDAEVVQRKRDTV